MSEFVLHLRETLDAHIPLSWVRGEVTNLTRAGSGHLYFSLKDAGAQIRCTMWRNRAQLMGFQLREGMQIEVRALVNIYEARGDLQLAVETIRQVGQGNLFEAFMLLKARLEQEGLFLAARKRSLPALPRAIGLITSPAAAALQDMLTAFRRRAPAIPLVLYPSPVQGSGAAAQLAAAIEIANARAERDGVELLIIARGGGSLEDLWAFNEEVLVRAVSASKLPVLCGVGHETDTTLADFAADMRAATPTAAAEIASSGWFATRKKMADLAPRLIRSITRRLGHADQTLTYLAQRLRHPRQRIQYDQERLRALANRLLRARAIRSERQQGQAETLRARLLAARPESGHRARHLSSLEHALCRAHKSQLALLHKKLDLLGSALAHLNPEAILLRGYAIVRNEQGEVIRHASAVLPPARLDIQFADAHIQAHVEVQSD